MARGQENSTDAAGNTLYVSQIGAWQATAYSLSWSALLALVVMAIVARGEARRAVAGAALGWAGGVLALMVNLAGETLRGGGVFANTPSQLAPASTGIGMYASVLGVLLLGGAAGMLLRPPVRRRWTEPDAEPDAGPLDLTVTPLPPHTWGQEGTGS
jgi:hypothetical protein